MKFLKKNSLAILLLIGAYIVEYLHTFIGVSEVHSSYINAFGENVTISLSDAVYYFTHSAFTLLIIIVIFVMIDKKKLASKVIGAGVITWFCVEFLEAYLFLKYLSQDLIKTSQWASLQILTTIFAMIFSYFGFRMHKQ